MRLGIVVLQAPTTAVGRSCRRSQSSSTVGRSRAERSTPTPLVEHRISRRRQQIGPGRKSGDDLVERNRTATGREAIAFALGTLVVAAEATEIAIASRLEQKGIDPVVRNTHTGSGFECLAQGAGACLAQFGEPLLRVEPERHVEITAFVPDLDAAAAELPEARDLLPERLCDRADDGDRLNFRELGPRAGDDIRRQSIIMLQLEKISILAVYLGAPHGFTLRAS